jgi:hypothetical protein
MNKHRSTHPRVSNEPQSSNFEVGTALENLRAEVVDIEALARAADAADHNAMCSMVIPARLGEEHPLLGPTWALRSTRTPCSTAVPEALDSDARLPRRSTAPSYQPLLSSFLLFWNSKESGKRSLVQGTGL